VAYGILRVGGVNRNDPNPLPALVVSHDQYGQMWRNATHGVPVRVEINVQNRFLTSDLQAYNVVADLPGTDLGTSWSSSAATWTPGTPAPAPPTTPPAAWS
jgi:hypothetical protein